MPIKILMPALSPTMTVGNLARWLKKEGDIVSPGEVIAEIETDKATMEVEAVDAGTIAKIVVSGGSENVEVNSLIAVLLEEDEDISALDKFDFSNVVKSTAPVTETYSEAAKTNLHQSDTTSQQLESDNCSRERILVSPLARRLAKIENIKLEGIKGSGPHGRIIKNDILNIPKTPIKAALVRNTEESYVVSNNNIRKIIAKRLVESKQTIPHFYLSIECNIDKLLQIRSDINESNNDDKSKKISVNDFVIAAVAKSLQIVPEANASWEDSCIRYYNNVDISVAVAIDGGLITPIIKNADLKSINDISLEMKTLSKKARENKLMPEEFQGGNFSISNLGMYGIKNFNAIINPPQSCILAVGASTERPVVINNNIQIANIMDITLSCDHRVVDGAVGAKFLTAFKNYMEKPALILI